MSGIKYFYKQRRLGQLVDKICSKVVGQDGAILYHITKNWNQIIGDDLFDMCTPGKITKTNQHYVLTVFVGHPALTLQIQANENMILESIARIIGYRMVKKLKFKHMSNLMNQKFKNNEKVAPQSTTYQISKAEHKRLESAIDKVENSELQIILNDLKNGYFS